MITEGIGTHAPQPVRKQLSHADMRLVVGASLRLAKFRGYENNTDVWKRGLVGDVRIPGIGEVRSDVSPRVVGLAAEAAVILYVNDRAGTRLSLDDQLRSFGDGGCDIDIEGITSQIKARQHGRSHSRDKVSLVRCNDRCGRDVLPKTDILVFCEVTLEDRLVQILGWLYAQAIAELDRIPARKGHHKNVEVPDLMLQPMSALLDRIIARKELA